jgi:hypothetical protein
MVHYDPATTGSSTLFSIDDSSLKKNAAWIDILNIRLFSIDFTMVVLVLDSAKTIEILQTERLHIQNSFAKILPWPNSLLLK